MDLHLIENEVSKATEELLSIAPVKAGQILVVAVAPARLWEAELASLPAEVVML